MFSIQIFFVHVYENVLEFLLLYFFLSQYKPIKPRVMKEKYRLILGVLLLIQSFFNSLEGFTINIIVSIIIQIILSFLFFPKWEDIFLSSIIAIAIIDIGEGIATLLLLGIEVSRHDVEKFMLKPLNTVLMLTIARLISLMLILFILRFRKIKVGNSELPVIYWLAFLFITMKDILWILILLDSPVETAFYYWAAVIPILLISYILFYYTRKSIGNMVRTQMKGQLLDEKKTYYEQQLIAMEQTLELQKVVRYDLKNKLSPLVYLAENGKTVELIKQVQELGSINVLGKIYAESGNITIDYIINQKFQGLAKKGVEISCEITVPNDIDDASFDLSTILGNLIDNAAEALNYVKDEKWIFLKVSYQVGFLIIYVTNSFDGIVHLDKNKIISRKKDTKNHGIGLNSIRTIAEEYSGELTIQYDEKKFDVIVKLLV